MPVSFCFFILLLKHYHCEINLGWNFWKLFIKMSGYQEKKEIYLTSLGASWPGSEPITVQLDHPAYK